MSKEKRDRELHEEELATAKEERLAAIAASTGAKEAAERSAEIGTTALAANTKAAIALEANNYKLDGVHDLVDGTAQEQRQHIKELTEKLESYADEIRRLNLTPATQTPAPGGAPSKVTMTEAGAVAAPGSGRRASDTKEEP